MTDIDAGIRKYFEIFRTKELALLSDRKTLEEEYDNDSQKVNTALQVQDAKIRLTWGALSSLAEDVKNGVSHGHDVYAAAMKNLVEEQTKINSDINDVRAKLGHEAVDIKEHFTKHFPIRPEEWWNDLCSSWKAVK